MLLFGWINSSAMWRNTNDGKLLRNWSQFSAKALILGDYCMHFNNRKPWQSLHIIISYFSSVNYSTASCTGAYLHQWRVGDCGRWKSTHTHTVTCGKHLFCPFFERGTYMHNTHWHTPSTYIDVCTHEFEPSVLYHCHLPLLNVQHGIVVDKLQSCTKKYYTKIAWNME